MIFRVLAVLALIALAISSWMLTSPGRNVTAPTSANRPDLPGYYLKNAVLTDFDLAGTPGIRIDAERIDQVDHGNEVAGNVRFEGAPSPSDPTPAIIHSDTMSYDITNGIATTKSDVRIDFGKHVMTGHGMTANMKDQTIRLESKVSGRFHP
jgi:lipopolysaccharide export system protein LptC